MPEIPPQTVTEEKYTDEYGNMVVKKVNALTFIFSVILSASVDAYTVIVLERAFSLSLKLHTNRMTAVILKRI